MNFKIGISSRIVSGYVIILLITTITNVISILQLERNKRKFIEISNVYLPAITYLKEFVALSQESNNLINDWIHIGNKEGKERLKEIHAKDYPSLKIKIENFVETSENIDLQEKVRRLLLEFDTTIALQQKIMNNLGTIENSQNDSLVDASLNILDKQIKPKFYNNQFSLKNVLNSEVHFLNELQLKLNTSYNYLDLLMILLLVVIIIVGIIATLYATKSITLPILKLNEVISQLGKGELPNFKLTNRNDEIGEMALAINAMIDSIKLKTEFATQTGKGNYNTNFKFLSEQDVLGNALVQMRNNLHNTSTEDFKRNWINVGLAKAGELLSLNNKSAEIFYNNIIIFLSTYLDANLGGLYILNDTNKNDIYLALKANYAYDSKIEGNNRILPGVGLAGQAALEKKIVKINNIPADYPKISSGLGSTPPKHIIIVPLVFENELNGLIELAKIDEFTDLQIEFLEKTAGNIAIAFDLKSRKSITEQLLSESRKLNEQLRISENSLTVANTELKTFVYKASHDLKGPLSTMIGLINILLNEPAGDIEMQYIQMISETANKLDKILLVLIKIMSIRDAEVKRNIINFNEKINEIVDKLKAEYNIDNIKIFKYIDNRKIFISDNDIIEHVLFNIIDNSIRYRNKSLPECNVTINISDANDGVNINISDNGIGISNSLKNRVFEMFFRGHSDISGSGLGLYFVKNAINKLEGKIELQSSESVGTMVTIYLPNLIS